MSHDKLGRRLEPEPMQEALKDAIATCYGLLWEVKTDDKRVHRARRGLLQWLTKEEQARGIEMARGVLLLTSIRGGPGWDYPCANPHMRECASSFCQKDRRCQLHDCFKLLRDDGEIKQ